MSCSISLCMIAKNEAHQIARCINSAKPYVDQIVVVDTGSTDNTVQIARDLGAEVYQMEWQDNFAQARNKSLEHASGDWILFLDCDEELDQATAPLLREVVQSQQYDGYWINLTNIFNQQPSSNFLGFRLFRNDPRHRFECRIHEQILPSVIRHATAERIGYANITVYHYGYEDSEVVAKSKSKRNLRMLEKARQEYGDAGFINFYLGVEYQRLGDYQKALDYYHRSLVKSSLDETYAPAMVRSIGYCLLNLKRHQEGVAFIDQYLKYYPDYTDLVYLKGILYFDQRLYRESLDCMNQCLSLGSPPPRYFSMQGIGDEKPKFFISSIIDHLIRQAGSLFEKGHESQAFAALDLAFSQLKKTPNEEYYTRLIETMLTWIKAV
ncbi:glycosyltransferase [Desulfotomaculum nigrificans]|uniref:glycosyltransferase n=1 Tax=Desulfotomaculum nigrificans TaxID=1565 RepID=UPI0001FADE5F|nr:glycosyltransferase family 2 protein [Desulfotomaculum nigrificans]